MYLSRIIDREKRVRVSSCRVARRERNDSPRKRCQFFFSRKRDCHRRSNLSSTRMTDRSTRRDKIFGSGSGEILLVISMGKSIINRRNILGIKNEYKRDISEVYNWYNFSKECQSRSLLDILHKISSKMKYTDNYTLYMLKRIINS